MAIYQENPDGSLTCIKADKTLTDVLRETNEAKVMENLPTSDCLKDLLPTKVKKTITKE